MNFPSCLSNNQLTSRVSSKLIQNSFGRPQESPQTPRGPQKSPGRPTPNKYRYRPDLKKVRRGPRKAPKTPKVPKKKKKQATATRPPKNAPKKGPARSTTCQRIELQGLGTGYKSLVISKAEMFNVLKGLHLPTTLQSCLLTRTQPWKAQKGPMLRREMEPFSKVKTNYRQG